MNGQIEQHHMNIPWHDFEDENRNILHADLQTKTTIIGRVGIMMLACGTGAWRVRESMNSMARVCGAQLILDWYQLNLPVMKMGIVRPRRYLCRQPESTRSS